MVRFEVIYCAILPMEIDNADTSRPMGRFAWTNHIYFQILSFTKERYSRGVLRCTASRKKVGVKDAGIMYLKNPVTGKGGMRDQCFLEKNVLKVFILKIKIEKNYSILT